MKFRNDKSFSDQNLLDIGHTLFITLLVTKFCNIKCWYCDVLTNDSRQSRYMTSIDIDKVIQFIDIQNKPKKPNICINFFGGEPTLNPNLSNIVYKIKKYFESKRNLDFLITTNLIKSLTYFKQLPRELIYACSFHSDWVKDPGEWFEKARYLNNNKQLYHVVLMLQKSNMDLIYNLYNENTDIPMIICPIDQIINDEEYINYKNKFNNQDMFEDSEIELFYDKTNSDKHHMCSSGLIIDEYGNLYRCWPTINNPVINIFKTPSKQIPIWHLCDNYTSKCDMEVMRSSIKYYTTHIKDNIIKPKRMEYTSEELKEYKNRSILFQCNA